MSNTDRIVLLWQCVSGALAVVTQFAPNVWPLFVWSLVCYVCFAQASMRVKEQSDALH